jgi:hypothetical protein
MLIVPPAALSLPMESFHGQEIMGKKSWARNHGQEIFQNQRVAAYPGNIGANLEDNECFFAIFFGDRDLGRFI